MTEPAIPFQITDWTNVPVTVHKGETGEAYWRTKMHSSLRLRMVEYTPGYKADHWCSKGHIIYCIEGEMTTELSDGSYHIMKAGMPTKYRITRAATVPLPKKVQSYLLWTAVF